MWGVMVCLQIFFDFDTKASYKLLDSMMSSDPSSTGNQRKCENQIDVSASFECGSPSSVKSFLH